VFDITAEVIANGSQQAVEVVLGPRFGDQSDKQTGSYTTPPSVLAYTRDGHRQQIHGTAITPPFATINAVDHDSPIELSSTNHLPRECLRSSLAPKKAQYSSGTRG
jgi:hypothetical protein